MPVLPLPFFGVAQTGAQTFPKTKESSNGHEGPGCVPPRKPASLSFLYSLLQAWILPSRCLTMFFSHLLDPCLVGTKGTYLTMQLALCWAKHKQLTPVADAAPMSLRELNKWLKCCLAFISPRHWITVLFKALLLSALAVSFNLKRRMLSDTLILAIRTYSPD